MRQPRSPFLLLLFTTLSFPAFTAQSSPTSATPVLQQFCFQCHGKAAMAGLNLQQIAALPSMADNFQHWEKVAFAIEHKQMPPAKMPQPSEEQRRQTVAWIRAKLNETAAKIAGDPGRVTVRRLTSGEYAYTVRDLTGLDIKTDRDFASDSVGGEGFTNFGDVQFMQDANLERYLETAKLIAAHAVIGSGPLHFFADPGKSGFELSAVSRIQAIYRAKGFRSASGEGGKPYSLDRVGKAIYAAWHYKNRAALGEPKLTLEQAAAGEASSPRFVRHLLTVFSEPAPSYPTLEAVQLWNRLPNPEPAKKTQAMTMARTQAKEIQDYIVNWPRMLFGAGAEAEGGDGDERNFVLSEDSLRASPSFKLRFNLRGAKQKAARAYLSVTSVNPGSQDNPVVLWRNATVRFRTAARSFSPAQPLRTAITEDSAKRLGIGKFPAGSGADPLDFAMTPGQATFIDFVMPDGAAGVDLQAELVLTKTDIGDAVVRATISNAEGIFKGTPASAILAQSKGAGFAKWKANVLAFSSKLPASSHGEPTPADKDPIPAPYNNQYNQPERDSFHVNIKYYRDDRFLMDHVLDDATRAELNHAWSDLLASFAYHDTFLRFVAEKYHLDLKNKKLAELSAAEIEAIPAEPRNYVKALRTEYDAVQKAQLSAQPRHIEDALRFTAKAWRRPLTEGEKDRLRGFYINAREVQKLDHSKAIRTLISRVLVAPAFLYRLERQPQATGAKTLTGPELASRLSYFLWSSVPDEELSRAAKAGELTSEANLERQVRRMIADPKARRFATEFFGQWLGFYRFDQYKGVDTSRYPEFTDELKSAMYDESVSFFEHIVRQDRPIREMFSADYTFLNQTLAKHYGVKKEIAASREVELVTGAKDFGRGGMLRLGTVLTVTSAPLRTSPVKRGDWVLRRILGTPTPPPPANAGVLPADDKAFGGLSIKDRLAAHQRNPTCASCHSRIDPLGFPLEHFDAVGRLREKYPDGNVIQDATVTADHTEIAGIDGLTDYLKSQQTLVLKNFSKKLLGYSLGRTMQLSDQPLIDQLSKVGGDTTISRLVTQIVISRQFRNRRVNDDPKPQPAATDKRLAVISKTPKEGGL